MVDPTSDSDLELNSRQFLQLSIAILASIVCLAALSATLACFFGEELKIVFGLRALAIAGASGYGVYYCISTFPNDFEWNYRVRNKIHRTWRTARVWIWRVKFATNSFSPLFWEGISRRLTRKSRTPAHAGNSNGPAAPAVEHPPNSQIPADETGDSSYTSD